MRSYAHHLAPATGVLLLLLTGCKSIGPGTITTDRVDYSTSISDSWKKQALLNIVKLRYMDLPVFVDVSSIVAGYSLQAGVNVSGTVSSPAAVQGNYITAGGQAVYTDRPTITYTPLTGQKFLRGLITPIEPRNIFSMLQSGYAADFILALTINSLNGLRNRTISGSDVQAADPAFIRVLQLMRDVQSAGAIGLRVETDKEKNETAVMFFRRDNISTNVLDEIAEIRRLLQLPDDTSKFNLIYSPVHGATNELGVDSRSVLQVMVAMASYCEVPEQDVKDQRALPSPSDSSPGHDLIKIKCSQDLPADAFVAVYYRHHWFWIDDRDWHTKRAFTGIMFLFTMVEGTSDDHPPILTIPAQ